MKKRNLIICLTILIIAIFSLASSDCSDSVDQEKQDAVKVNQQQEQFAKGQPLPFFDWSLERELLIKIYESRNKEVATHSVWRSDYGMVEGDCASMGYGLPYDVSLTNPLKVYSNTYGMTAIGQPEPNGIFASTNTNATWVMCVGEGTGLLEPHYVESKVTVYPYPVKVNYETNRVIKSGKTSVSFGTLAPPKVTKVE